MKHLSVTLFGVAVIGIALAAGCTNSGGTVNDPTPLPVTSQNNTNLCESEMVWVTLDEALARIGEYGDKQWNGINARMNGNPGGNPQHQFQDSRFITFPMDSIKKFICKVEQMIGQFGTKKEDGSTILPSELGVRFYYAAYPGLTPAEDPRNTFKGRHTLLLVPTYLDATNTYIEFFPAYVSASGSALRLSDISKIGQYSRPFTLMLLNEQDVAKNQGTLCPPPEPCNAELLSMSR